MRDGRSFEINSGIRETYQWQIQAYRLVSKSFRLLIWIPMLLLSFLVAFLSFQYMASPQTNALIVFGAYLLVIIIVIMSRKVAMQRFFSSPLFKRAGDDRVSTYSFGDQGIFMTDPYFEARYPWQAIEAIEANKTGVFFLLVGVCFKINAEYFEDEKDMQVFAMACKNRANPDVTFLSDLDANPSIEDQFS